MQTSDDEKTLAEWSGTWKNIPVSEELSFAAARRQQSRRRLAFYMDLLHAVVLFIAGLFFFWLPLSLPTLIGAPVLIGSACLVVWGAFKIHHPVIHYADWSTHGILCFRQLNYLSSIKHLRLNQLGCVIVIIFAVTIALLHLWLPRNVPALLAYIYIACLPALILLIWWMQRRIKHYCFIVAQIESLLYDFEETSPSPGKPDKLWK